MSDQAHSPTVVIRDLRVQYDVRTDLAVPARQVFKRVFRSRGSETVVAIECLDLTIHKGEAVGLVGSNGSGKSTLLRTIAGLQPKVAGSVLVSSQPQFLGVGAALKLKASGRRNVYLGGLALGLTVEQIDERFDRVLKFSGLGNAIDRPMIGYSSGMRSRLAFSIATLTTPEILLLDEALAVGDRSFRDRSVDRINAMRADAKSVLLVTHNLGEIRQTCDRAVWLDQGRLVQDGPVEDVLSAYEEWSDERASRGV
ncbi:MAG: ABC transporter ATP-binding protein [Ilumatobacter sp.]